MKHSLKAIALCCCPLTVCTSLPASAAEERTPMTFRITAEQSYLRESELKQDACVIHAGLYIDNYSGITEMAMQLKSDEPLRIENGDFTRDDSRQEFVGVDPVTKEKIYKDKPCFFTDYGVGEYTQHSEVTGEENAVLWCSAGWMGGKPGELYRPESSFLSFDIVLPAGTKPGIYCCCLSTASGVDSDGFNYRDLYVYNGSADVTDSIVLKNFTITVEPDALRGDVNCDGEISVDDAQSTLLYYTVMLSKKNPDDSALAEIFGTPFIHTAQEAADVSTNGEISLDDAQSILAYYTAKLAGKTPDWNQYI